MIMKTADELAAEGARLRTFGKPVAFVPPWREHLAVAVQTPFVRQDTGAYEVVHERTTGGV